MRFLAVLRNPPSKPVPEHHIHTATTTTASVIAVRLRPTAGNQAAETLESRGPTVPPSLYPTRVVKVFFFSALLLLLLMLLANPPLSAPSPFPPATIPVWDGLDWRCLSCSSSSRPRQGTFDNDGNGAVCGHPVQSIFSLSLDERGEAGCGGDGWTVTHTDTVTARHTVPIQRKAEVEAEVVTVRK